MNEVPKAAREDKDGEGQDELMYKNKVLAIARVVCSKILCKCEVDPQELCFAKINFLIKLILL